MRARDECLPLRDVRRVDLCEAAVDLEVEHPRDESALECRACAAQQIKARARNFRAARDVEDAELLADLPMWLCRERKRPRLVLADNFVVLVHSPDRRGGIEKVGDVKNELVALCFERAELRLDRLDALTHLAHPGPHRFAWRTPLASLVPFGAQLLDFGA